MNAGHPPSSLIILNRFESKDEMRDATEVHHADVYFMNEVALKVDEARVAYEAMRFRDALKACFFG